MPEQFGHYVLEGLLGRGGMGEVYRAYDTRRDRIVALKRLPKELVHDETFQARFRRECRLVARLNEPHVIPIHDFGEIEGHLYLDMRLVEGSDLASVIGDDGPLSAKLAVDVIGQVGSALQAAHDSGLVHRDVKPSNVLLTGLTEDRQSVFAYLVDFGIARSEAGGGTALTATTGTVGTLGYMAPERISGGDGDHRSDVYSLACVLYECLTGHSPFKGETFQVMFAHVNVPPPVPSTERAGLPPALDEVVRRGLAKDPAQRYQTVNELTSAARAALASPVRPQGPPGPPGPGPRGPMTPPGRQMPPGYPAGRGAPPPGQQSPPGRPPMSPPGTPPPGTPQTPQPGRPQMPAAGGTQGPRAQTPPGGPTPQAQAPRAPVRPLTPPPPGPISGPLPPAGPSAAPGRQGPSGPGGQGPSPISGPIPPAPPRRPTSGPLGPGGPAGPGGPPGGPGGRGGPGGPGPAGGGPGGRPPGATTGPGVGGPPPGGGSGGSGLLRDKRNLIAVGVALVAVIAAVVIVVLVSGGGGSPSANGSNSPHPTSSATTPTDFPDTSASSGPSSSSVTSTGNFTNYTDFSDLIGSTPGDTSATYKNATCNLAGPTANITGMIDQVICTKLNGTGVEYYVARFKNASDVSTYVNSLVSDHNFKSKYWTEHGLRRGKIYTSPSSAPYGDVTTAFCGKATYLVDFFASSSSGVKESKVYDDFWKPAPFPNEDPPVCGS